MKKISLFDEHYNLCALSNVCFMDRCDAIELECALRHTKTANEFLNTARVMTKLDWKAFDETDEDVTIRHIDSLGNKDYLRGVK